MRETVILGRKSNTATGVGFVGVRPSCLFVKPARRTAATAFDQQLRPRTLFSSTSAGAAPSPNNTLASHH